MRCVCSFYRHGKKKKKDTPGGLKYISPSPLGAARCPCGDIAATGLAEWEFKKVFANALLQFWSWWGEPWAKLGLSEWCLRGILRGPDNPFSLSSHRWVCSAAAPREITRLLSTYKIHLWNGMVLRQTCHCCSFFFFFHVCVCARMCVAQKGCFLGFYWRSDEKVNTNVIFKTSALFFMWTVAALPKHLLGLFSQNTNNWWIIGV